MRAIWVACALAAAWPAVGMEVVVEGLFRERVVLTVDGQRRVVTIGETSPEGVKVVSADAEGAVLEIDGNTARYPLGSEIGASYAPPVEKAVKIWPQSGMFFVMGSVNGLPVRFLVDTGASSVAMNANEARRLGIAYRLRGEQGEVATASGTARAYRVMLNSVKVGELQLTNVEGVVIDGDSPGEVLLGNSFLGRIHMERDGQSMVLRQRY